MSATPNNLQAAVQTAANAVKVANELKARLDRAPKPADPALVKAAAEKLVDFRWVHNTDAEKVAQMLGDPNVALQTLAQIAQLAAEKVASVQGAQANPRLEAGRALPFETRKQASEGGLAEPPESDADRIWNEKMASRRQSV